MNWVVKLSGQIGWKSIEITLYACLVESVELGGQIGWKSIEIMPGRIDQAYEADDAQFDQASSQWISTQFDCPI